MEYQEDRTRFFPAELSEMVHQPLHLLEVKLPVVEALLVHADIGAVDDGVEWAVFLAPCHKSGGAESAGKSVPCTRDVNINRRRTRQSRSSSRVPAPALRWHSPAPRTPAR